MIAGIDTGATGIHDELIHGVARPGESLIQTLIGSRRYPRGQIGEVLASFDSQYGLTIQQIARHGECLALVGAESHGEIGLITFVEIHMKSTGNPGVCLLHGTARPVAAVVVGQPSALIFPGSPETWHDGNHPRHFCGRFVIHAGDEERAQALIPFHFVVGLGHIPDVTHVDVGLEGPGAVHAFQRDHHTRQGSRHEKRFHGAAFVTALEGPGPELKRAPRGVELAVPASESPTVQELVHTIVKSVVGPAVFVVALAGVVRGSAPGQDNFPAHRTRGKRRMGYGSFAWLCASHRGDDDQ